MRSSTESKIYFFFQAPVTLKQRTRLKRFLVTLFRKERKGLKNINYIFCTDEQLLLINQQYLKHDYYTDIITFELSPKGEAVEGEVYISIDRIRENASLLSEPIHKELHRVIFHGALHLCGYKDKSKKDIGKMRAMEEKYLQEYF